MPADCVEDMELESIAHDETVLSWFMEPVPTTTEETTTVSTSRPTTQSTSGAVTDTTDFTTTMSTTEEQTTTTTETTTTTTTEETTALPGVGNTQSCTGNTINFGTPPTGQCLTNLTSSRMGQMDNPSYNPDVWGPDDPEWHIAPQLTIYKCPTSNKRIIQSNGIPNHDIVYWNPNAPCEQFWQVEMSLTPEVGYQQNSATELTRMAIQAMAINGIPIYGATEAHNAANAVEPDENGVADAKFWYGHAAQNGMWHYHSPQLGEETVSEHAENTLIGFALDGFPLYGPVADASILDECNGRFRNASDPSTYQYHVRTAAQVDESQTYCQSGSSPVNNWNYILGCYKGDASATIIRRQQNMWGNVPNDCVEDMELESMAHDETILSWFMEPEATRK